MRWSPWFTSALAIIAADVCAISDIKHTPLVKSVLAFPTTNELIKCSYLGTVSRARPGKMLVDNWACHCAITQSDSVPLRMQRFFFILVLSASARSVHRDKEMELSLSRESSSSSEGMRGSEGFCRNRKVPMKPWSSWWVNCFSNVEWIYNALC